MNFYRATKTGFINGTRVRAGQLCMSAKAVSSNWLEKEDVGKKADEQATAMAEAIQIGEPAPRKPKKGPANADPNVPKIDDISQAEIK